MTPDSIPGALLLLAYGSLLVEMTCFGVPSEASTRQLLGRGAEGVPAAACRPMPVKLVAYLLPACLGVAGFALPLLALLWPPAQDALLVLWPPAPPTTWIGLSLVVAGRALGTAAVLRLRPDYASGVLQERGAFRVTRNPILVGMGLVYLGNCVWLPSVVVWALFVPFVLNMHRRVLIEEEVLRARLGDAYGAYAARVPRYVSWPAPRSRRQGG